MSSTNDNLHSPVLRENASIAVQNALALAQQGLFLEAQGNFQESHRFFEKAALLLEDEKDTCDKELISILSSLAVSYANKGKMLLLEIRKQQSNDSEQRLLAFDVMDPYSSFVVDELLLLPDTIEVDYHSENDYSFENLLNILDEQQRVHSSIALLLKTMTKGGNISKRLFVSPSVWLMQLDYGNNDLAGQRFQAFRETEKAVYQMIVSQKYTPSLNIPVATEKLRTVCLTIVKNYKNINGMNINGTSNQQNAQQQSQQNNQNVNNSAPDLLEQYTNSFMRQFRKIINNNTTKEEEKENNTNINPNNPLDYFHCVFGLLKHFQVLFQLLDKYSKDLRNNENNSQIAQKFQQNKLFLAVFARDFIIANILKDLQSKYQQYLIFSKKKLV